RSALATPRAVPPHATATNDTTNQRTKRFTRCSFQREASSRTLVRAASSRRDGGQASGEHGVRGAEPLPEGDVRRGRTARADPGREDRKSTRLNSSHVKISYAVFC